MRIPRGFPKHHDAAPGSRVRLRALSEHRVAVSLAGAAIAGLTLAVLASLASTGAVGPATSDVTFVQYAVGQALGPVAIRDEPGGRVIVQVDAGVNIGLGGRVGGGESGPDSYWVEVPVQGRLVHGFADAPSLLLVAGTVTDMDLEGVDPRSLTGWVAPQLRTGGLGIPWLPEPLARWSPLFVSAGEAHDIDPALLAIIALVESGGQPDVESGAGAVGLMQIMPGTAGDIARWRGLDAPEPGDLRDPERNVDFGAYYAARMLDKFGSDPGVDRDRSVELAAAAYNGGPGAAMRWLDGGQLPAETERYRGFVLGMWRERTRARSETFEGWCRAGGWRLLPPPHCPFG